MATQPSLTERLERLARTSNRPVARSSLEEVLQSLAAEARELIGARFAAIGLLAADRTSLSHFTTSGLEPAEASRIGSPPRGRGILGLVIREARPLRLRDLTQHPASAGFPSHHPPMHSFLGVPVVGREAVVGNLYLTDKIGAEEFSNEDEYLAILFAERAAAAVEDARAIAESNRLLVEVQGLLRTRERFFAMVNHELRNSLAAVLGWAEMLVRKKDPATVPRAAFEVLEAAQSAASLINDLLDLSRLDENRLRPEIRPTDCGLVLRRAIGRITPAAEAKGVRVELVDPGTPVPCLTDAHRVEQILVNLLTNAVRHSPNGGPVDVRAEADTTTVRIVVEDRGPGIAPNRLDRIFDVYYGGKDGGPGIGLGLPLSRRLARLLGGELDAANRVEGGATFTLTLPLAGPS